MCINGNDKKSDIVIIWRYKIFLERCICVVYIYMLKMFYVYIIFIDCILFFDISCGYYIIFKK